MAMLAERPEDPRDACWRADGWRIQPASGGDAPASGGEPGERELKVAWGFIRELHDRHRGEVRELHGSGYWSSWDDGPLPREVFHTQLRGSFIRVTGELAVSGALASGSRFNNSMGQVDVRRAKVFSLGDLFFEFGERYTARELYEYYLSCRVIATRRTMGAETERLSGVSTAGHWQQNDRRVPQRLLSGG